MYHPAVYKTSWCDHRGTDRCRGKHCAFAHTPTERREAAKHEAVDYTHPLPREKMPDVGRTLPTLPFPAIGSGNGGGGNGGGGSHTSTTPPLRNTSMTLSPGSFSTPLMSPSVGGWPPQSPSTSSANGSSANGSRGSSYFGITPIVNVPSASAASDLFLEDISVSTSSIPNGGGQTPRLDAPLPRGNRPPMAHAQPVSLIMPTSSPSPTAVSGSSSSTSVRPPLSARSYTSSSEYDWSLNIQVGTGISNGHMGNSNASMTPSSSSLPMTPSSAASSSSLGISYSMFSSGNGNSSSSALIDSGSSHEEISQLLKLTTVRSSSPEPLMTMSASTLAHHRRTVSTSATTSSAASDNLLRQTAPMVTAIPTNAAVAAGSAVHGSMWSSSATYQAAPTSDPIGHNGWGLASSSASAVHPLILGDDVEWLRVKCGSFALVLVQRSFLLNQKSQ